MPDVVISGQPAQIKAVLQSPAQIAATVRPPASIVATLTAGQGPAGVSAGSYQHTQGSAAATWIVNHNLGYRPAVVPLSTGGVAMLAEVVHASANQALVYFDSPTAGLAVCS